jgi:hypothetical protein
MPKTASVTSSLTRVLTQDLFKSTGPTAVSNSKSLAFDGSDQHLITTADSTLATKTYSWWAQSADTGVNGIFDHGDYNIGAFFFNYSSNKPLLYLESNWFRYWNDTSCQDDGSWHHWLLLLHTNISNCRLFCDGVEQTVQSTATGAGAGTAYTTDLRIGRAGTNYFSGHLDEFAVFDGDKTDIVADLYNNGVPTNLSGHANLEHWWRMGDATEPAADGTNDLIFDQTDKTLGSEVLTGFTNGSTYPFDTFASSGTSITSAIETSGNWGGCASNSFSITSGEVYKVTFNLTYNSGTNTLRVVFADNANGAATQRCAPYYTNTNGVNTVYVKATATDSNAHLQLGTWNSSDSIDFSASNISVKKVNGATATMSTNMAPGDIVQYTPNSYILSDLGITPDLAVSMTRKLVSDYSGSLYATSGSDVTTIYDQSGNSRNLTNWDNELVLDDTELSGSGNSARAVFNTSSSTVLTTSTAGSAFAAGNHDVFIVFDPVGSNKQIIFGRGSHGGDFLAMDNGSNSNCINGITIGAVRVNDTVLTGASHVSRDTLWDAMTIAGTMGGLNVLSLEDVDLSSISGDIRLGVSHNTWKLEGSFAEFIITPPLTDAEHSAVVENIRAHYDAP